ncbi:META domain-containing protein [Kribbella sp. NPDC059898]|uniref:META domain-containing protein n=1 Tax=Kribbella sp. NPDC059898 TaxID=3346995 RepID=UPI00364BDEEB
MTVYGPLVGGDKSPLGKTYLSVRVTVDGVERPFVLGTRLWLQVRKDGLLAARAGCNEFNGLIMLDDGVLLFERGIVTQMNCGDELNAQDEWIAEFLTSEPAWVVDGDVLTFTSGSTTLELLDRRIAEPDLPLDGTTWAVKSVVLREDAPPGPTLSSVPRPSSSTARGSPASPARARSRPP